MSCSPKYTLTEQNLKDIGGCTTGCDGFVSPVNTALSKYNLDCPKREAAFLAQIRHETAGFTSFIQTADDGAGAIHMLPANFRYACRKIPEIEEAFKTRFTTCTKADSCECGEDSEAAQLIAEPDFAFLTAAWWFDSGSAELLGKTECADLGSDADIGLGVWGPPQTGYNLISYCIKPDDNPASLTQRNQYYDDAWAIAKDWETSSSSSGSSGSSGSSSGDIYPDRVTTDHDFDTGALKFGLVMLGVFWIGFLIFIVYMKQKQIEKKELAEIEVQREENPAKNRQQQQQPQPQQKRGLRPVNFRRDVANRV
eukprot:TRINITY_DN778016_c0_g1_i1.p1 TRINITY_DN778016_c0_g1~~TRINITY_DN778016_c0_g1_i1.p1  ORF type:complete len:311 (-),score=103.95 TRINITY_DN778016_c0_g1_i1:501-1433(-)